MMHNPSPPHSFLLCLTRTVGLLDNLQRNQIPWFYSSGEMRKQKEIPCPLDSVAGWTSGAALAASTSPSHLFLPGFLPNAALLLSRWPLCSHVNTALVSVYSPPSAVREGAGALFLFRSRESF